jgi:Flp pilus assembly protein TadD
MELNDIVKLTSFGEKSLAADPNNTALLTLLANAFAEDPKGASLAKADSYSRKAIELLKSDATTQAANRQIEEGFDHEILGYTLLRQEKTAAAIIELKKASTMVKGDSAKYSVVLYRLGFAYAKDKQTASARQVLTECETVDGPFKDASKELLAKLGPAHPARK